MKEQSPEYILSAAIHFNDGKVHVHQPKNIETGFVITGRRHHNVYSTLAALADSLGMEERIKVLLDKASPDVQGFITNLDRFVGRAEAYEIALKANQVEVKEWDNSLDIIFDTPLPKNTKMILISEDLY